MRRVRFAAFVAAGACAALAGVLVGALILSSINSFLVIMSVTPQLYLMVLAALVILALIGDDRLRRWAIRQR